jgi:hypothetical protein
VVWPRWVLIEKIEKETPPGESSAPVCRAGEPASSGKGSHPGENSRAECRFVQSKEQGLGQAAEVGLLERFLAREGAQFRVNEPPAGERENVNIACQRDGRAIHREACVRQRDLVRTLPAPDC